MTTQFSALMRTYKLEASYPTNISAGYLDDSGSKWGVWEMLRESFQNAMDEAELMADNNGGELLDYFAMHYYGLSNKQYAGNAHLEFRDKGRGVDWERIFLIGESGKRGTHYRGQKGEGEGLSFLVAARFGVKKIMFSQDWAVQARLDNYDSTDYKVLVFDLYRTDRPVEGTVWRYYTNEEIEQIVTNLGDYFPQLSKKEQMRVAAAQNREWKERHQRQARAQKREQRTIKAKSTASTKMIITPPTGQTPRLYVRGIYVKDIYSLFSYNLKDVEINRDRSMVSDMSILSEIEKAFNSDDLTDKQAQEYWRKADDNVGDAGLLEFKTVINVTDSRCFNLMRDAFYKVHGKKACIFTNRVAALDAQSLGFKVVDLHTYAKDTAMALGIHADKMVLGYDGDVQPIAKPTNTQKALMAKLAEIGKAMGFKDYTIVPVNRILGVNDENLGGMYKAGTVYLMKSTLDGDRLELLETYIHEAGHGESGASDATRSFTDFFEKLVIAALTGRHDGVRGLIDELIQIK